MGWTRRMCLVIVGVASSLGGYPATGGVTPLTTERVAAGLIRPIFVTAAPGDFVRLFIVEKRGVIRILNLDTGVINGAPFLDINPLVGGGNNDNDERGLLGLAFHPDYQSNGFFYVNYTANSPYPTTIRRYSVSGDPDVADSGSGMTLLTIAQPYDNHNGGWMGFGPNDGYLYIGTGDGGLFCDPGQRSQDITNQLLGKMLRIDVDGDGFPGDPNRNYAIPTDNPFVGTGGDDEIWAYGLRNPWRCAFDPANGDLYIADVGQDAWEEVDFQPADSRGGENYGWDCMEGNHCPPGCPTGACTCFSGSLVDPIHEFSRGGSPFRCSITGGEVYRGCAMPDLQGVYFFADWCSNQIWSFLYDGANVTDFQDRTAELDPPGGQSISSIVSFGKDTHGEMYIVEQSASGEIYKIVRDGGPEFDCNNNGVEDACDIFDETSPDGDGNGIPDECECEGRGSSTGLPICDDGDACTIDVCDPKAGCVHDSLDCNDDDACTTDGCDSGTGCLNEAVDCNDDDACTTDGCDAVTGCSNEAVDCDDSDACTVDSCDVAMGCANLYFPRSYGDVTPFGSIVPPCTVEDAVTIGDGFANMLDVYCAFSAFDGGFPYTQCPCADVAPCGGDSFVNMQDVFAIFNAFNDSPACPDPCP